MFFQASFISLVTAAALVASSPVIVRDSPISLPLAVWINETGIANVVQSDLARIASFKKDAATSEDIVGSVVVQNTAVGYTANVGVGTPPTYCKIMSHFYCACIDKTFRQTYCRYWKFQYLGRCELFASIRCDKLKCKYWQLCCE